MIDNGLVLTPKELYCLGGILSARYIDYAYIAALDDIGQDYALFEKETRASLVAKGMLEEDFSGEIEPDEACARLLQPVFFGTVETSLNICSIGEELKVDVYNYHFYRGKITLVKNHGKELLVSEVAPEMIEETVKALVPGAYTFRSGRQVADFDKSKVTRFFSAKSVDVGKASRVKTFIEFDGMLCTEADEEKLVSLSADDFIRAVNDVIKGAM